MSHEHVVIVPVAEYEALVERLALQERQLGPAADYGQVESEAFMANFDPARSGEWRHVAYCISVARVARYKQESGT